MVTSVAATESSPLSVRLTVPRAPTMSPASLWLKNALNCSPRRFFSKYSCTVPLASCARARTRARVHACTRGPNWKARLRFGVAGCPAPDALSRNVVD
eukprot:6189768-Pleurochrysis_carterae.AAC.4